MFNTFVIQLKSRLNYALPGEAAQFTMAPLARQRLSEIQLSEFSPKLSAVLVLLYPEADSIHTLLIERHVYNGHHSGQIAFPGGKFEDNDFELKQTALREAFEEIGVFPEKVQVIGNLTDIYITPSNFLVKPFVGVVEKKPDFIADVREVNQIISVDLFSLNDKSRINEKVIMQSSGENIKTPYYEINGLIVWGATAMIISELNVVVQQARIIFS